MTRDELLDAVLRLAAARDDLARGCRELLPVGLPVTVVRGGAAVGGRVEATAADDAAVAWVRLDPPLQSISTTVPLADLLGWNPHIGATGPGSGV